MKALVQSSGTKKPLCKRRQWSEQAMVDAMKAVEDGMSVAKAAREHNVPRTTLQDRVSGNVVHGVRPGPEPYLTHDEETKLAEYITECASAGCSKTRAEIMSIAENIARNKKQLRKKKITHGWYDSFIMRTHDLLLHKEDPSNISAGLKNAGVHPDDKIRPTVETDAEEDSKGGTSYYIICI